MSIVAYARFSPRPNPDECDSIEKQLCDIAEWAVRNGKAIRASFDDPECSGADRTRLGLCDAINALKKGDSLVVRDWSRIARDTEWQIVIARQLYAKGCKLISVTEGEWSVEGNPMAKFVNTIFAAMAEMQRDLIRARTSAAMRRHQRDGRAMGSQPPYGFKKVGKELWLDAAEQANIQKIQELDAKGLGCGVIANILHGRGSRCRGGMWHASTVKRILARIQEGRQPQIEPSRPVLNETLALVDTVALIDKLLDSRDVAARNGLVAVDQIPE
jgi:DNA invertase Pin-like site-specific DNA recombinase